MFKGFDEAAVAIGGVTLIPLIIGLIEFLKRLFPQAPATSGWLRPSSSAS